MLIKSDAAPNRTYDQYDFTFVGGVVMPITLDIEAGDTVAIGDDRIFITIQERPSLVDPEKLLPAEDLVLERRNLLGYTHRLHKQIERSAEEQAEWDDTLIKLTRTVN